MGRGDERDARRLLAAVTVTGAALWMTSTGATARDSPMTGPLCVLPECSTSAHASHDEASHPPTRKPLSLRVQELQEKVRASSPLLDEAGTAGQLRNIVQFFNFMNCQRKPDGSCR